MWELLFILLMGLFLFCHVGLGFILIFIMYDLADYELSELWKLPIVAFWPIGFILILYCWLKDVIEEIKERILK